MQRTYDPEAVSVAVAGLKEYLLVHRRLRSCVEGRRYHGETAHLYPAVTIDSDSELERMVREEPAIYDAFSLCGRPGLYAISRQGSRDPQQKRFWYGACADHDSWQIHQQIVHYLFIRTPPNSKGSAVPGSLRTACENELPAEYMADIAVTSSELEDLFRENGRLLGRLKCILPQLVFSAEAAHDPGNTLGLRTPIIQCGHIYLISPDLLWSSLRYRAAVAAIEVENRFPEIAAGWPNSSE